MKSNLIYKYAQLHWKQTIFIKHSYYAYYKNEYEVYMKCIRNCLAYTQTLPHI